MNRRVGLTANAPGLLKTVGNRPRQARKAPIADDAPPLSTDDEDDTFSEGTVQAAKASDRATSPKRKASHWLPSANMSDSDSSAHERSRSAAIKPTTFSSRNQKEKGAFTKRRRLSDSPERESPHDKDKLKPGNHLTNKWGFPGKKQTKNTYGKGARGSQSSQPGSSQGSNKQLRVPSSIESPQKKKSSKLILPDNRMLSSPSSSPKKLLTDLNGTADSEDEDSILAPLKISRRKVKKGKKKPSPPSSPPRAVFKLPQNFLDNSPGGQVAIRGGLKDLPKLSTDEDDEDNDVIPKLKIPEEFQEPPATRCPWCDEEVDKAFLDDFSKGKRLNVRLQTRFCQLHKQRTATQTWKDLGYPEIDWAAIESRFAAHRDHLLAIVEGRGSHFRDVHARNVAEGRARSMRREESFNPGYYGPRGLNVMCDYLVGEFGDALKRRAVDDRVIAGRGSAAFIQAVLVAELGVRLIMEDMKLSETRARQVMEDSKILGELVQPELER